MRVYTRPVRFSPVPVSFCVSSCLFLSGFIQDEEKLRDGGQSYEGHLHKTRTGSDDRPDWARQTPEIKLSLYSFFNSAIHLNVSDSACLSSTSLR